MLNTLPQGFTNSIALLVIDIIPGLELVEGVKKGTCLISEVSFHPPEIYEQNPKEIYSYHTEILAPLKSLEAANKKKGSAKKVSYEFWGLNSDSKYQQLAGADFSEVTNVNLVYDPTDQLLNSMVRAGFSFSCTGTNTKLSSFEVAADGKATALKG